MSSICLNSYNCKILSFLIVFLFFTVVYFQKLIHCIQLQWENSCPFTDKAEVIYICSNDQISCKYIHFSIFICFIFLAVLHCLKSLIQCWIKVVRAHNIDLPLILMGSICIFNRRYDVSCRIFKMAFIMLRKFPSISTINTKFSDIFLQHLNYDDDKVFFTLITSLYW